MIIDICEQSLKDTISSNDNIDSITIKNAIKNLNILETLYNTLIYNNCICVIKENDLIIVSQKDHDHLPLVEVQRIRTEYMLKKLLNKETT